MSFNWKASGLFAAGVAFGTAGIKILSSKDAKRAYTQCTAADTIWWSPQSRQPPNGEGLCSRR